MKRSQEIRILMQDYCTREEAKKHLDNGSIVISKRAFKKDFESYMSEWDYSDEEVEEIRESPALFTHFTKNIRWTENGEFLKM
jgi:hypothetical protein